MLPTYNPQAMRSSYTLQFPRHSLDKSLKFKVTTAWSKVKSRSYHDLHTPQLMSLPSINFLHLTNSEVYNPDKILKVKVTTARSRVKSRLHHDIVHLHPLINVPTLIQRTVSETRADKIFKLKVTTAPWQCTPTCPN